MILSNTHILAAIEAGEIIIDPLSGRDVSRPPFNTSAIDLRLADTILVPKKAPIAMRLDRPYDKEFVDRNCEQRTITVDQPYNLEPNCFVLGKTLERVGFPIIGGRQVYAARVEGRSSLARYGLLIHFTAPTIHSAFEGTITLEMINLGHNTIALTPGSYICQLIVEVLSGTPSQAPNQFAGQIRPSG
jgi:dCTP deaminase